MDIDSDIDEIVSGGLTRKSIHSYEERKNEGKTVQNNLYPKMGGNDQTVDHPMDTNEDTHSVQNGEDEESESDHSDSNQQNFGVPMPNPNERKFDKKKRPSPAREKTPPPKKTLILGNKNLISPSTKKIKLLQEKIKTPMPDVKAKPLYASNYKLPFWTGIIALAIVVGFWVQIPGKVINLPDQKPDFNSIISNLSSSFNGQPEMSFKVVRSALKAVSAPEPQAPAIILLLASKGAEKLALNLGNALVTSVSSSPIAISGKNYQTQRTDIGKKSLDETLRGMDATADSRFNAVLVKDLHLIPGETALMLHTYCDSENAPYKHVVYVLIVNMEEEVTGSRMKDWDVAVNKRLDRAWNDVDEDQRAPLLSRLTVSVAGIFVKD